jgi:hypothetical protein
MIMTRCASVLLLFLSLSVSLFAQDPAQPKKIARPDIPGTFILELGFNRGREVPLNFVQSVWGSRTLNLYYQYPVRILKSNFSFVPGAGFSFERFKLSNNYTLNTFKDPNGSYSLIAASNLYPAAYKSMIVTNYFEIPLAFRFDANPEDPGNSFNITLGGRAGALMDAFTKIKYKVDGETRTIKDKQAHGLNPFRYGVFMRAGVGGFHFFTYYNLSTLFDTNKGPQLTKMNTVTFGISIDGF